MNTLPNGVQTPTSDDLADLQALLTTLGNSFSDALGGLGSGKRQPRRYRVANQTEKAGLSALTSLQDGDMCFVADTGWWELYLGSLAAWRSWETTRAVPWTISHTGLTPGSGLSTLAYSLSGDIVTITGSFRLGSTSAWTTSSGYLVLPFSVDNYGSTSSNFIALGECSMTVDASNFWQGMVMSDTSTADNRAYLLFDNGATGGRVTPVSASNPSNWTAGNVLGLNIRYRRKIT